MWQAGSEQIVNGATKLQAQATPRVGNEKITTANLATKNCSVCIVYTRVCLCVFVCVAGVLGGVPKCCTC